MTKLAATVLLSLLAATASASDYTKNAVGTTGSQLLQLDIGARGISMGGAYAAVTNDVYSMYWNPAGLARVPRVSVSFTYSSYLADIAYQAGAGAVRVNDTGVIALGYRFADYGSIHRTDLAGNDQGTFTPRDYLMEAGWGQSVYDLSDSEVDVNVGVSGRWLHSDYVLHADSYSGDIGMQARFYHGSRAYDFAFVAQNVGSGQKFDKRRDTTPFQIRLGGSMQPMKGLTLGLEIVNPSNNVAYGSVGAEYTAEISRMIKAAVRAGFNSQTLEDLGVPTTVSAGAGLSFSNFTVDYAFVPFGLLGDVHRVSLSWNLPAKTSRRYRERN